MTLGPKVCGVASLGDEAEQGALAGAEEAGVAGHHCGVAGHQLVHGYRRLYIQGVCGVCRCVGV